LRLAWRGCTVDEYNNCTISLSESRSGELAYPVKVSLSDAEEPEALICITGLPEEHEKAIFAKFEEFKKKNGLLGIKDDTALANAISKLQLAEADKS